MEILPFSDARYGRLLWVPIAALAVLVLADPALAAETGSEFSELWTLLSGWCSGFLGKSLAIAFCLLAWRWGSCAVRLWPPQPVSALLCAF